MAQCRFERRERGYQCTVCGRRMSGPGAAGVRTECRPGRRSELIVAADRPRPGPPAPEMIEARRRAERQRRETELVRRIEAAIAAGRNGVTREEIDRRLAICRDEECCDRWLGDRCAECGCSSGEAWFAGLIFDATASKRWACPKRRRWTQPSLEADHAGQP